MKQFKTYNFYQTQNLAKKMAQRPKGNVYALVGELGSGKTTFAQGFAQGLGIKDKILSPTFILIRQHPIPKSSKTLYHLDLYRMDNTEQIKQLGIEEIISDPDNIVLIEWAEKAKKFLPQNITWIFLKSIGQYIRELKIKEAHS